MIDITGLKVLEPDKLKSGFRVKHNLTVDKLIVDMTIVGPDQDTLRLITHGGETIDLKLGDFFYTKEDLDDLFFVPLATEEKAGRIRIGTWEEVRDGQNDSVAVTPYKLTQLLHLYNGRGITAEVDMEAGVFVAIYQDEISGLIMAKPAIATAYDTLCDGFLMESVEAGDEVLVKFSGAINTNQIMLTPHTWYYLRDEEPSPWEEDPDPMDEDYNPLQISPIPPSGTASWVQPIGYAISESELMVELSPGLINLGDVFEDLPALIFTKGVEMTVSLQLKDYLIDGIDSESLTYQFENLPSWIASTMVVFNYLSFTGTGDKVGEVYVDMIVSSGFSRKVVKLLVKVVEAPKVTWIATPGGKIVPGEVKQFEYTSSNSLSATVVGDIDGYRYKFAGASLIIDPGFTEGSLPVYNIFIGQVLAGGLMRASMELFKITGSDALGAPIYSTIHYEEINYVLGDNLGEEDPDVIINAILLPYESPISSAGEIFEYEDGGINIRFEPVGVPFEVIEITMFPNDVPYTGSITPFGSDLMFPSLTEKGIGEFAAMIVAKDDEGEITYQRLVKWIITEKTPEPPVATGGLRLVQMNPSSVIATLSLSGTIVQLPSNGFNVLLPGFDGQEVDRVTWTHEVENGGWSEVDIERFVGRPAEVIFNSPTITVNQLAFWNKDSKSVGSIHEAPSRQRTTFYGYMDGVLVAVKQGEFFLSNTPLGPSSGMSLGYLDIGGESITTQIANLPTTGGFYPLLSEHMDIGNKWVGYTNTLNNSTLFDGGTIKLNGTLVGTIVNDIPRTTINMMPSEYLVWGTLNGEGHRIVGGVDIDVEGEYTVEYTFTNGGVAVGTKSTTFVLYDEDPEIKDPEDCCKGNIKTTGDQAKEGVLTFLDSPVVPEATELNQAVNLGQVQSIIAGSITIPFSTPSTEWTWNHNFGYFPIFDIIIGGRKVGSKVEFVDSNTVKVYFKNPQVGLISSTGIV